MGRHHPDPPAQGLGLGARREQAVRSTVQHLAGEVAARLGGIRPPEVRRDVTARSEEVAALPEVVGNKVLQLIGKRLELGIEHITSHRCGPLLAEDQVHGPVARQVFVAAQHGLQRGRVERVAGRRNRAYVQGSVIERIPADHIGFVVAAARAEGQRIDRAARLRQVEDPLRPDVGDVDPVGHAVVLPGQEPGQRVAPHASRGAHPVEPINDKHRAAALRNPAGGHRLAREALAAGIDGRHPIAVDAPRLLLGHQVGALRVSSVVEAAVIHARIDDITVGHGRRLERIDRRDPRDADPPVIDEIGRKGLDGQRLHDIGHVVLRADVAQNPLVDRTADEELEARVAAISHVGEILV